MSFTPPIQVAQLKSNRLVVYDQYLYSSGKRGKSLQSLSNLKGSKYKGEMSEFAKKNMAKVVDNWIDCNRVLDNRERGISWGGKPRFVMLTLTLSAEQLHSDSYIKRHLLNHFLVSIKRKFGIKRYIWKAEFQQNENIHFHIILDQFIPAMDVRGVWNAIQSQHGYIDRFEVRNGHRNPNSTDIHQIRDISKAQVYMRKYMSKSQSCRIEGGKCWGCSDSLNNLRPFVAEISYDVSKLIRDLVNEKGSKVIDKEGVKIIYGNVYEKIKGKYPQVGREWKEWIMGMWQFTHLDKARAVVGVPDVVCDF